MKNQKSQIKQNTVYYVEGCSRDWPVFYVNKDVMHFNDDLLRELVYYKDTDKPIEHGYFVSSDPENEVSGSRVYKVLLKYDQDRDKLEVETAGLIYSDGDKIDLRTSYTKVYH